MDTNNQYPYAITYDSSKDDTKDALGISMERAVELEENTEAIQKRLEAESPEEEDGDILAILEEALKEAKNPNEAAFITFNLGRYFEHCNNNPLHRFMEIMRQAEG